MPLKTPPILDEINALVMALYIEYASHEPDGEHLSSAFDELWDHIDVNTQTTNGVLAFAQRFRQGGRTVEITLTARITWDGVDNE